jgi:nitrite reductase/ring-hydroxylating ferredoxin subunit
MAEDCKRCPLLVDRRSLLRSGAALAVATAFADGCTSSEPVDINLSAGGSSGRGTGGEESTAGAGGQLETGGASGASGSAGGSGSTGEGGAGGTGVSRTHDAGAMGGSPGSGGGAGGTGAAGGGGSGAPKTDAGAGDLGGLAQCPGATAAGKANSVAVSALVSIGYGLVVGRDGGGLYAMSSICTHAGCGMNIVGSSLHCPVPRLTIQRHGRRHERPRESAAPPLPARRLGERRSHRLREPDRRQLVANARVTRPSLSNKKKARTPRDRGVRAKSDDEAATGSRTRRRDRRRRRSGP